MLLKIAVCDDELSEIKRIKEYITRFSFETGIEFMIDRYSNGKNLIQVYNKKTVKYDILFLDVEMPELNGIKTAQKIREIPDN
ncbi:response regulator [Ruminococcus sp. Marseille-P6503]|uniref:response regulator n=1 Tax=Ruminococcus sp. Marseille-P6503 TaxID=2364796 RepID=UPI0013DE365E|nr:response regulator [Ruminococcus sp. Marseille-P6503]